MKEKSLSGNIVLNAIKTFMSIGFPLISFPYISRILQVENIGKVNFVISIINYYSLVATLGLTSYAIREGSIVRNDIKKRSHLFDELFSLNVITTIVAYILLGISLVWIPSFQEYRSLLLIYSLTMLFNAIGVGWACSVFEDYLFITVRSIIFQFLALVMMFLFIHKQEDYYKYTWIMVFQVAGTGVSNLLHVSKVHRFKFTTKIDLKKHIKPVLTLFATEIATTIYVSSDTTVIGFLAGDYYNGLYAVSTKIYRVAKQMLAAILQVAIPRLSNYYNNGNMKDFEDVIQEVGEMLILVLMPIVVGIFYCAKPIIILLSGIEYTEAYVSLQILSISLVFAIIAWFLSQCVIVPKKMESLIHKQLAKVKPEKREQFEQRHSRELILYDAAARYLKELKDSGEGITPKAWQREIDQLTAGKQTDTLAMKSMREDLKAVERLRKTAEQLSRQERDKSHDREPER